MYLHNVGLRIKELRKALGMSQEMFANSIGMARTYFATAESGRHNLSLVSLKRITDGLGVTLAEFFDSPLFSEPELTPFDSTTPERISYTAMRMPAGDKKPLSSSSPASCDIQPERLRSANGLPRR